MCSFLFSARSRGGCPLIESKTRHSTACDLHSHTHVTHSARLYGEVQPRLAKERRPRGRSADASTCHCNRERLTNLALSSSPLDQIGGVHSIHHWNFVFFRYQVRNPFDIFNTSCSNKMCNARANMDGCQSLRFHISSSSKTETFVIWIYFLYIFLHLTTHRQPKLPFYFCSRYYFSLMVHNQIIAMMYEK